MNVYVMIYEGFAQFEVVLANYFLTTVGNIVTVGGNDQPITSTEGFLTQPHTTLDKLKIEDIDLFIIPGGDPKKLYEYEKLYILLNELNSRSIPIGAICSGVVHLGKCGALNGREFTTTVDPKDYSFMEPENFKDKNCVIDGNIVTAKANGYVDFALELGKLMKIYKDEDDYLETLRFFKEFKDA